ncbi:MAG TPA: prepilin peptidase [Nevskiaceae bacterium]|nr:prepilin peptidase [Nevskiaceae bacterium]
MIWLFIFIFGLCVGSFLNVVVYRLNHNLSPFRGRSVCPKCKHKLAWHDNIPLFSFILLRGKCRYCHSPISWQYPLVELAAGILTVVVYQLSVDLIFNLLITYVLIAIFVSDLRYMTIPDKVVYPAIFLSLVYSLFGLHDSKFILSGLGAAGFFLILVLITRSRGMGVGDVKLAGLMGLLLGWPRIVVALFLAFLTGSVVGVILILLGKKRFGEHIPFGPFLAGGTWVALFWGWVIWQWYWQQMLVL